MNIIGVSAFYHDSAAALIRDGHIVAAAQEERFTRRKNDPSFPVNALRYCLQEGGIELSDVDCIAFYEDTDLKLDRILRSYVEYLPGSRSVFGQALVTWLGGKLFGVRKAYELLGYDGRTAKVRHHLSHAASAFYPSRFDEAAILVMDGVGEWACTSIGEGGIKGVRLLREVRYPHSLGMLYSAFTQYVGFEVNEGEYKLMGLAPYGNAIFRQLILDQLIDVKDDGSYTLNLEFFNFHKGRSTINERFERLLGAPARRAGDPLSPVHCDAASSIQSVLNEVIIRLARTARAITGKRKLVIAGGVGLNCVSNGLLAAEGLFDEIWIQPAAGDAGGALGAALYTYFDVMGQMQHRENVDQGASLLGPEFSDDEIDHLLRLCRLKYRKFDSYEERDHYVAELVANQKVVGLFQGRMEFGPRALGARSIIADACSPRMQREMNLKIKHRESFRPFAPAVLKDHAKDYFEIEHDSPYMLFVVPVSASQRLTPSGAEPVGFEKLKVQRSQIPAVTHVDYSARIQTVDPCKNKLFYGLIEKFFQRTGCPVIINTSFNVSGEPIVCNPEDALKCFFGTDIDAVVLNRVVVLKEGQDLESISDLYRTPEMVLT